MCGCFAASALCIWRCFIIGKFDHQINEEIRDKEIRVIGAEGDQLGIMSSADALRLAGWAIMGARESEGWFSYLCK